MGIVVPGTLPSFPVAFDLQSDDLVLVYQSGQTPSTRVAKVGELALSSFPAQNPAQFFASPPGVSGTPVFRALQSSDVTGALGFSPVQTVAGRSGAVTLAVGDVSGAAPIASPEFTGSVTAPALAITGNASIGGALTLSGNPTTALQAATKGYADLMLPLAGGTMTGALTNTATGTALSLTGNVSFGNGNITSNGANLTVGGTGTSGAWQGNSVYAGSGRTINRSGAPSVPGSYSLYSSVSGTGIPTGFAAYNYLVINSDTWDSTGATNAQSNGLRLDHNFGGAACKGSRNAIQVQLIQTAKSGSTSDDQRQYTAGAFWASSNQNEGGSSPTSGNSAGFLFGINPAASLTSGATAWSGVFGGEVDVSVASGASAASLTGWLIHLTPTHSVRGGNGNDTALAINSSSTTANSGWTYGVLFGSTLGQFPMYSGGTLMGLQFQTANGTSGQTAQLTTPLMTNGIDLSYGTFTGNALLLPGITASGTGALNVANMAMSSTASGVSIDVPNQIVTAIAISTAGNALGNGQHNYYPGDTVFGPTNGRYTVTTTKVIAATVASGGSGGTNGTQTVTGTTGTGTKFQASVTVSGGAITAVNSISTAGSYTVNPTNLSAEPVTGAGLTGATLNIGVGIATINIIVPDVSASGTGTYPNPVSLQAGSGSGATATLTWSANSGLSLNPTGQKIGFNGSAPVTKPTVTGSKGANAALASLLTALASYGLVTDSTT